MTSMPAKKMPLRTPLRVLIVEDRAADAELMLYELERSGYEPVWQRVESEADYLSQLQTVPDIILADHTLPEFGARRALDLLKASALDIPLIVITGSISEETAVDRLKQGAADYILKDRMARLGDAVARALRDKKLRDEKQQAEQSLKSRYAELQALQEISQIILTAPDIRTTMEKILDKTAALGPYDIGVIRLLNPATDVLEPTASHGYSDPKHLDGHRKKARDDASGQFSLRTMQRTGPRVEEDVPRCDGLRTWKKEGVQSAVVVPVRTENEILGAIQLGSRTPRKFQPDEIRLLVAIGDQMGIAIQKAHAQEETERNLQRINALHDIDLAITSTLDLRAILDVLLQKIDFFLPNYSATTVRLFNEESGLLEPIACRGLDETEWKAEKWKAGRGIPNAVFETKASRIVRNVQTDPDVKDPEFFRKNGLISYLGVPLIAKGEVLGVLSFYTKREHQFSAKEVEFLATLAGQAAIAIYNARLFEKIDLSRRELELTNQYLEKSLKQLSGLYTALTPLTPSESVQEMVDGVIERLTEATGADAALIRLYDKETGAYPIAGQRGFPDDYLKRVETAPPGGAVDWVFKHGEPIIAPDIASEPRLKGKVQLQLGLRSCAVLPLKAHDEVRGIIHLSSRKLGYFDAEQQDHLMAIARQMEIALENRELFDSLKASRDELEIANKVKNQFLSVMSHELRTPLSVVMGYAGMVKEGMLGEINPKQEEALRKVLARASDQLQMINEIMQTTQIEARTIAIEHQMTNLADILRHLGSDYETTHDNEDVALLWDYPSEPMPMITDINKLKQILQCLINNAIKFTDKGSVTVSARLFSRVPPWPPSLPGGRTAGSSPNTLHPIPCTRFVELKVSDTGIGIPKEYLDRIFDKFYQVDSSETRLYGGVGLGLYIVKHFTELLRGTVNVESAPGKGSTFTVNLPWEE
jgi:signal transduction histidine kinase/CheY-like chemotaxis protein